MRVQEFGPVRLILPNIDAAIGWRRALLAIKAAAITDPVEAHLAFAGWCAGAAAALSADTDAEGRPQTWGDQARGKAAGELVNLGDEIVSWLTSEILAPVEAGEKTAGFFARPKAN